MQLIPYVQINGFWTISDDDLIKYYNLIKDEGTADIVFYNGKIKHGYDFIELMRNQDNLPVFICDEDILGVGWINGIVRNHAFSHFSYCKKLSGEKAEQAGNMLLEHWFNFKSEGKPVFDLLLGLIPSFNKKANRYIEKLNFIHVGEIPLMVFNSNTKKNESAVLSYRLRDA